MKSNFSMNDPQQMPWPYPMKMKIILSKTHIQSQIKNSKPWPHMYQYQLYYWIEYAVSMQCEWPHKSEWPITAMVFVISKLLACTSGPLGLVNIFKSGWEWIHTRDFIYIKCCAKGFFSEISILDNKCRTRARLMPCSSTLWQQHIFGENQHK